MSESTTVQLAGKRALITGGGVRLGRAIAIDLARQGCNVLVHYNRSSDAAESLVAELTSTGLSARAVGADLGVDGAALEMFEHGWAAEGPIDFLVNNASIFEESQLEDIELELDCVEVCTD